MNTTIRSTRYELDAATEAVVKEKLAPIARLLGKDSDTAHLEVELENAPAEGRSATPTRLSAKLSAGGEVYHGEVVKPTAASAADRVRGDLEASIKSARGRSKSLTRRGSTALKKMLRFGRH